MNGSDELPGVTLLAPDAPTDEPVDDGEAGGGLRLSAAGAVLGVLVFVGLVGVVSQAVVAGPDTTPSRSDTARTPATADPLAEARRTGSGPILADGPEGLVIAVGGHRQEVHLLDLDTGDVRPLNRHGAPELIHEGHLLSRDDWNHWSVTDLTAGSDPEQDRARQGAESRLYTSAIEAEAGGVWFRHPSARRPQIWSRVDPLSGEVLQQVSVPEAASVSAADDGTPLAGPELVGSDDGGIYTLEPDGSYRLALEARLIAFGEHLVLVSRCDEQLRCRNEWFDRSFAPVDVPAPAADLGAAYLRGDRVLVAETFGLSETVVKVYDIATGEAVATGAAGGLGASWVSPSGRYLAVPGYEALLITDLRDGGTVTIDRLALEPTMRLVWGRQTG